MGESETVLISRKEIRGLQINNWVSSVLLGGTGAALTVAVIPDAGLHVYVPIMMLMSAFPIYSFLWLERRRRNLPSLPALRFCAATLVGVIVGAVAGFGLEKLFL